MNHARVSDEDIDRLEAKLRGLGYGAGKYAWPLEYLGLDSEAFDFVTELVNRLHESQRKTTLLDGLK